MAVVWLALLVAVVGLVVFLAASNPKVARVGEILFAAGSLATLLAVTRAIVRLP